MSWFSNFFEKKDWRLVKELQAGFVHVQRDRKTGKRAGETSHEVTYYLYENQFGKRKFDAVDSLHGDIDVDSHTAKDTWTFRSEVFRYTIRPWLDGRHDPDIQDYEQVEVNDFHRRLKGKK